MSHYKTTPIGVQIQQPYTLEQEHELWCNYYEAASYAALQESEEEYA
jgi:hypothetical protein